MVCSIAELYISTWSVHSAVLGHRITGLHIAVSGKAYPWLSLPMAAFFLYSRSRFAPFSCLVEHLSRFKNIDQRTSFRMRSQSV